MCPYTIFNLTNIDIHCFKLKEEEKWKVKLPEGKMFFLKC